MNGINKELSKAGNKTFKIVEIPYLNHLFQSAKTGSPHEYSEIEETTAPIALDILSSWILGLK